MDAIPRLAKLLTALGLTLCGSTIMTPIWLIRAIFLRRKAKTNILQYWLTSNARMLLNLYARTGAQPGPYTYTPTYIEQCMMGCTSFEWILPVGVKRRGEKKNFNRIAFDDESLPVKLAEKEYNKRIGGLWYRNKRDASPITNRESPVVLYFHGGAFITLDAGDIFFGITGGRNQAWYGQVDVLSVTYRLAPGSKYPSQLYEAYSAFCHLKRKGYNKIFIGGDSAGANLALSLWKYLDEISHESDSVSALLLFSPWVDMKGNQRKGFQNSISDCLLTTRYVGIGFESMQTSGRPRSDDPHMSPIKWSSEAMKRLPPLFITDGSEETLLEEGKEFAAMARSNGVDVVHYIQDGHPHDFQVIPFYPTAVRECFTAMGEFVKERSVMA